MQSLQLVVSHQSTSSHLEQCVTILAVTGEAAVTTPDRAGLGMAWWRCLLCIAGTYPSVFFCRSSPPGSSNQQIWTPLWTQEFSFFLSFFLSTQACYTFTMCIYFYSHYFPLKLCKLFKSLWHFHGRVYLAGCGCVSSSYIISYCWFPLGKVDQTTAPSAHLRRFKNVAPWKSAKWDPAPQRLGWEILKGS